MIISYHYQKLFLLIDFLTAPESKILKTMSSKNLIMKVRRAIIAAAGLATRMYPYTKVESKLMIPVLNKPVIAYLLEELAASGIEEVIIVSNHTAKLQELFRENPHLNDLLKSVKMERLIRKLRHVESLAKLDIIKQEQPYGWMHEVYEARRYLKGEPFLVCYSDVLFSADVPAAKQIIKQFKKTKKNVKGIGRHVFHPYVLDMIDPKAFSLGKDVIDLSIFRDLAREDKIVDFDIDGEFLNVGEPYEYLKAQTYIGLQHKKYREEYKKYLRRLLRVLK